MRITRFMPDAGTRIPPARNTKASPAIQPGLRKNNIRRRRESRGIWPARLAGPRIVIMWSDITPRAVRPGFLGQTQVSELIQPVTRTAIRDRIGTGVITWLW